LTPYLLAPASWTKEQITSYNADSDIFPGLAGIGLPSAELLADYRKLPRANSPWAQFIDLLIENSGRM
jgi:hypothetical protein